MDELRALLDTVTDIYSAPGNIDNWSVAVESVTKVVGGDTGVYFALNGEDMGTEVSAEFGYDQEDIALYQSGYGAETDIRFQYMHNLIPGQAFREFEFVTDEQGYRDSKWIQFQKKKYGLFWCMSAHISTHNLWHDIIAVNRLEDKGAHTDAEKAGLQTLLPHLSRAMELHRTMSRLESRYGAVLSVLDKLLVGLIITDTNKRVVVSNSAAKQAAETSGAFQITSEGLIKIAHDTQYRQFAELLERTVQTTSKQGHDAGGVVAVPSNGRFGCLLFEVMPIRDDGFSDASQIHGAAVFVIDPDRSETVDLTGISKIFGLTEAESNITRKLVDGMTLDQISETRGASIQTVRSQLKTMFAKTGAKSQTDVVRLALKASPPIK
ncbi:MAG: helix-turn-helix transcriptional regulator [Motiliproteus sp.]